MPGWSRYLTPSDRHRALGLVCLGAGAQEGQLATVVGRALGVGALVLVTQGSGALQLGSAETLAVTAPALLYLPARLRHTYGPDAAGWSERWLLLDGPDLAGYTALGLLRAGVSPVTDPAEAVRAFDRVRRTLDLPESGALAAAAAHLCIATVGRSAAEHPALQALAADAAESVPVTRTARRVGLTVEELRAVVKEAAGVTPKEYVMTLRINRAKEHLADTDDTVAAIARASGFADAGYFTRQFTRRVGQSPSAFRAAHQRS